MRHLIYLRGLRKLGNTFIASHSKEASSKCPGSREAWSQGSWLNQESLWFEGMLKRSQVSWLTKSLVPRVLYLFVQDEFLTACSQGSCLISRLSLQNRTYWLCLRPSIIEDDGAVNTSVKNYKHLKHTPKFLMIPSLRILHSIVLCFALEIGL